MPDINTLNRIRERILANEEVTATEMSEAIDFLRGERASAAVARERKRGKPAPELNLGELFANLPSKQEKPNENS